MDVQHNDAELEQMEADPDFPGSYSRPLVRAFRKVLNLIRAVRNETALYQRKGLRLERLKGNRDHQHSMRLNDQWRLIVEFHERPGPNNNVCVIEGIEDYH
jgi:toxin HigB-1